MPNFLPKQVLTYKALLLSKALLLFISLVSVAHPIQAENQSVEYKVKAGYLYNFTKFIEWPEEAGASPGQSFSICLLGNDPFGEVLAPIKNKKAKGQPIEVLRFTKMSQGVAHCKILFISNSEQKNIKRILQDLSGHSVLVVGDMDNFAEEGGIVGFLIQEGRVRLKINHTAALRARLNISAKLLEIAQVLEVKQ